MTWLKRNYDQPSSEPKNGRALNIEWLAIPNNEDIDFNHDEDPDDDDDVLRWLRHPYGHNITKDKGTLLPPK